MGSLDTVNSGFTVDDTNLIVSIDNNKRLIMCMRNNLIVSTVHINSGLLCMNKPVIVLVDVINSGANVRLNEMIV